MTHSLKHVLLILALLITLLLLALGAGWSALKHRFAIEHLSVSGFSLSGQGLGAKSIELHHSTGRWQAEDITLNAGSVRMGKLWLWLPEPVPNQDPEPLPRDVTQRLPRYAPTSVQIEQLYLDLPCQGRRCTLEGTLHAERQDETLTLALALPAQQLRVALEASLRELGDIQASVWVDDVLKARLRNQRQAARWLGELSLEPVAELNQLLLALTPWLPELSQWPALPYANAQADWNILAPEHLSALGHSAGSVRLALQLKAPWTLPKVGVLSGELTAQLRQQNQHWQPEQLHAALTLTQAPWWAAWPETTRPSALHLNLAPHAQSHPQALALEANLTVEGPVTGELKGPLWVFLTPELFLQTPQAQLRLQSKNLRLDELQLHKLTLEGPLRGQVSAKEGLLEALGTWQATAEQVQHPSVQLRHVSARFTPQTANLSWQDKVHYQAKGELALDSATLKHTAVHNSAWHWRGALQLDQQQLHLSGDLTNRFALALRTELTHRFTQQTKITAELAKPTQALSGLAQTLTAWPAELEITKGSLNASASAQWPDFNLSAKGQVKDLSGLYQTSELTGLNGPWQLSLGGQVLRLSSTQLDLERINSGIGLDQLVLRNVNYQAVGEQWQRGRLEFSHASGDLLGGKLQVKGTSLNLAQPSQTLAVEIQGLKVAELLKAYPAEGLSGTGTLDAVLPVTLSAQGIGIAAGQVQARSPGGQLAFRSEKLDALAARNQAMQMTAQALDNFHFQTLKSSVDLSSSGTLLLGFVLTGYNPDLEQGRAINLTINLEEDLPALFKSLQLSGKVSERIEHKVRERLNTPTAP